MYMIFFFEVLKSIIEKLDFRSSFSKGDNHKKYIDWYKVEHPIFTKGIIQNLNLELQNAPYDCTSYRMKMGYGKRCLGHSQCRLHHTLYGHLLPLYLLIFADVALYLLKKEREIASNDV